ncbi:MAG: UDP-N-acetylglucosamine--N-acetylmuramyl-(pentapeptide) pyrophosphoryl-undecaprenol N-acetylglucosamine transferase [candidate division WOR-3 bacterium]
MKILITAIGTGGHIFPAIEVAHDLTRMGVQVILLVRPGRIEDQILQKVTYRKFYIKAFGFAGKDLITRFKSILSLIFSVLRLNVFMKSENIKGVFGTGGFGMMPAILAAIWRRIPFYILELNRIPGLVTRLVSRFATLTYLAFPLERPIPGRTLLVGVPIRSEFRNVSYQPRARKITVLGGSQGARRLNEITIQLAEQRPDLQFIIITGTRDYASLIQKSSGKNIELVSFTDRPWEYLKDSTLAISRSGSNTIYELLTLGIPMILIPFPYAIYDHQTANARYLEVNGAAVVILEQELNVERLNRTIDHLLTNGNHLQKMRTQARRLVLHNSASRIACRILGEDRYLQE